MKKTPAEHHAATAQAAGRSAWPVAGAILSLGALAGCTNLPLLEVNACGNGVVEAANLEDCDGNGSNCGAPNTPSACHFTCDAATRTGCAPEYGCGIDGICRRGRGEFGGLLEGGTVTASDLLAGDINGDGCAEMVLTSTRSSVVTSFDSPVAPGVCTAFEQVLATGRPGPEESLVPQPMLQELNAEGKKELIIPGRNLLSEGLSLYFPHDSEELTPILYPFAKFEGNDGWVVTARVGDADALITLPGAGAASGDIVIMTDLHMPPYVLAGPLGGLNVAAGVSRAADLDPTLAMAPANRCDELILALGGAAVIRVYHLCDGTGKLAFSALADVKLPSGVTVRTENASLQVIDMNGDGHLDILTNASDEQLHVAYGQGEGHFHTTPPPLPMGVMPNQQTTVLAGPGASAGEIFVAADFDPSTPEIEIVGLPCPPQSPFESPACRAAGRGCEAKLADIDADGDTDIITTEGEQQDVVVHRNVGDGSFHETTLPTLCPPHYLALGDVDGDGVNDIAFFDQVAMPSKDATLPAKISTTLSVAYGNAFAAPTEPEAGGLFEHATGLSMGEFITDPLGTEPLRKSLASIRNFPDEKSGVALVEGHSERLMLAPFYFTESASNGTKVLPVNLVAAVSGRFATGGDNKGAPGVAVITKEFDPNTGSPMANSARLWLVAGNERDGKLGGDFIDVADGVCDSCMLASFNPGMMRPDRLLLLGKKTLQVYEPAGQGFALLYSFDSSYEFRSIDGGAHPPKYVPRPVVADLDDNGTADIVARAMTGELIALWGNHDGMSFTETVLVETPTCPMGKSCGGLSAAAINGDKDKQVELLIAGPGRLDLYDLAAYKQSLGPPDITLTAYAPPADATFTAAGTGDFDGDGIVDLALMPNSNFITVLRGVWEHE